MLLVVAAVSLLVVTDIAGGIVIGNSPPRADVVVVKVGGAPDENVRGIPPPRGCAAETVPADDVGASATSVCTKVGPNDHFFRSVSIDASRASSLEVRPACIISTTAIFSLQSSMSRNYLLQKVFSLENALSAYLSIVYRSLE